ncbi:MAG TPA: LacI family DNA-binding transcriptional regulator [Acidobacteriota bacterium]|nr:LacI family DNA-binding transcriptional regulator [Acidobacteriota bacterium]
MATIREIARRANVSVATVSNVINGGVRVSPKLRQRVEAAIKEMDYHPNYVARSLKTNRTRLIGMVISDITNPFFPQLVRGAEEVALTNNYLLITFNSDDRVDREKRILTVLRNRRVDGILLVVAPQSGEPTHIANVVRAGIPVVCVDRLPAGIPVDSVTVDNTGGARECIEHLLSLGHKRVAIVTGPCALQTSRERLAGYKAALAAAGLPIDPSLIREGDFRVEGGYKLGRELLERPDRPTALFVSNNTMALGLLKAVEDLRLRCPEDIAIAIFDDLPFLFAFRPHLTAVSQPAYEIGQKAVELLLRRIEGREQSGEPVSIRLKTELKIRESTVGEIKAWQTS